MNVVILGASSDPNRYANVAVRRLVTAGHQVMGVNPKLPQVPSVTVVGSIRELPAGPHTASVYLSPRNSTSLADEIVEYGFARVIFNPGSENPQLMQRLRASGAHVVEACTLVRLLPFGSRIAAE